MPKCFLDLFEGLRLREITGNCNDGIVRGVIAFMIRVKFLARKRTNILLGAQNSAAERMLRAEDKRFKYIANSAHRHVLIHINFLYDRAALFSDLARRQ